LTDLGSLWTLGYSGMNSAVDLAELLRETPVDTIVDVRLRPFGKAPFDGPRASQHTVEALGIAYRWDQRLGNLDYRTGGIRIKDIDAIEDVLDALRAGQSVALLCACREPEGCHRSVLAAEAVRRQADLQVVHLMRQRATEEQLALADA